VIVVDTSVLIPLYVEHEHSEASQRLMRVDGEWIAPVLWRSEVANVLWKYVSLRGMELSLALEILQACRSLMVEREFPIGTDEALLLACESGCSAYDAEFVALARRRGLQLATRDRQLLRLFPRLAFCPS
jgi:predicted nucleic acid-binding protein